MTITKGEKLAVTKKAHGACANCDHEACQPRTDNVTVDRVIRRGGVTRVYVTSETYGYGYTIRLEGFLEKGGQIAKGWA